MGFVHEIYSKNMSEEDKKRIATFGIHSYYSGELIVRANWTIDRERDIVMIGTGAGLGKRENEPTYFCIVIGGQKKIYIEAWEETQGGRFTHDLVVTWEVLRLRVDGTPEELPPDTVREIVREALAGKYSPWTKDTRFATRQLPNPVYGKVVDGRW